MNIAERQAILQEVAQRNPMLLVDGYNVDFAIVQVYAVLDEETEPGGEKLLTHEDIMNRIDDVLAVMYAGIV